MNPFSFSSLLNRPSTPAVRSLVLFTLILLVLLFFLVPLFQQLNDTTQLVQETRAQRLVLEQAIEDRLEVRSNLTQLNEATLLDLTLPTEDKVISYIEAIESDARETSVTEQLTFHTPLRTVSNGLITIPLTMNISGQWNDVIDFLALLEQEPFYLNTTTLDLSRQSLTGDVITIRLSADSYWLPTL